MKKIIVAITLMAAVALAAKTQTAQDMAGLRVLSVEAKSLLDQLGLKKNDVIASINGHPVTKIEDIELVFKERKTKVVNMEVIRNGVPETFTFDLK